MLTQERLQELLSYDPRTGEFRWRVNRGGRALAGTVAGSFRVRRGYSDQGRRHIDVDGMRYQASHLAWLYVYGAFARRDLDHIDGNTDNNRIANLREASNQENHANMRLSRANTCGAKGVSWHKGAKKYSAQITVGGKKVHLGLFPDIQSAHAAYCAAASRHFGQFARFA